MAIKAIKNKDLTYKYIPLIERGEKDPFTVTIRPLTSREFSVVEDVLSRINPDQTMGFAAGSFNFEIVRRGLVDWENLLDEEDKPVEIKKSGGMVSIESMNMLPVEIITELATVISNITKDPANTEVYLGAETVSN